MRIFAYTQTHNQVINSKTEAHSNPLWIVGERANKTEAPLLPELLSRVLQYG